MYSLTGNPLALDAVFLLSHPLSYRCHGLNRTRCGEGAGLVGPWCGPTRASYLIADLFARALNVQIPGRAITLHINNYVQLDLYYYYHVLLKFP